MLAPGDPPLFPEAGPSDPLRPSLFELLAQDQLRDLLHPIVRYVLAYFAQRHPRYLLRLLNHHEEFFACLLLLIERHHLRKHNASLSEHFYQLHLAPSSTRPRSRGLSRSQRWGMLLFLVGVPYIRARAQDYFERLQSDSDGEGSVSPAERSRVQTAFSVIYPYANLSWDLFLLGYDLAYLFEKTTWYRPWHRWLGLRVQRRDPDDQASPTSWSLPPLLPPLLIALKLSQWWYSAASPRTLSTTTDSSMLSKIHRAIQPPRPLPILPKGLSASMDPSSDSGKDGERPYQIDGRGYGRCPLCSRKWQNPAILPSGWVVCWRCGWDALEGDDDDADEQQASDVSVEGVGVARPVKRKGQCPITGVPVGPGQLRRVLL